MASVTYGGWYHTDILIEGTQREPSVLLPVWYICWSVCFFYGTCVLCEQAAAKGELCYQVIA